MNTNKNITKINIYWPWNKKTKIQSTFFKFVIRIIKQFSTRINCLELHELVMMAECIEILSLVPKITHLLLRKVRFIIDAIDPKKRCLMEIKEDLNLYHLKTLSIENCCNKCVMLFNRLPPGILTEFSSNYDNLNDLKVLFKRQTNITKLALRTIECSENQMPVEAGLFNQKLESLEWNTVSFRYVDVKTILSCQTNLKSLHLTGNTDVDVMNVVMNQLTELETLSIYLDESFVEPFKNIKKLKNLMELSVRLCEVKNYEVLANLNYPGITTLNIIFNDDFSDYFIAGLAKSMINLKFLLISCGNYTNSFTQ